MSYNALRARLKALSLPMREPLPETCYIGPPLLMDSQAIPLSQTCCSNLRQEQGCLEHDVLSLAAIEEADAEGMEPKHYRMV